METDVTVPGFGGNDDDAVMRVVAYLCQAGQRVAQGQAILEAETDKAVLEIESPVEGVLKEYRVKCGDTVRQGDCVATVEQRDDGT